MTGSLLQLVAYGVQDVYLSGDPQMTYFKAFFSRHTNFSMEDIELNFDNTPDFGKKVSCIIPKKGDLITKIFLKATLTKDTNFGSGIDASSTFAGGEGEKGQWVKNVGQALIKTIELEIGGLVIDKQYGLWLTIWDELSINKNHEISNNTMLGNVLYNETWDGDVESEIDVIIPLNFFCCKYNGLAIPLLALKYHSVKINLEFETSDYCTKKDMSNNYAINPKIKNAGLLVRYIYIDSIEKEQIANASHEYLIEQLQFLGKETYSNSLNNYVLNFKHPCKEIIWAMKKTSSVHSSFDNNNDLQEVALKINGSDRFPPRKNIYFNSVQPLEHHTKNPSLGIYSYSFCRKPEKHQPTGTLNFSRIDEAYLNLRTINSGEIYIYAINYNVLKIISGMSLLAYD